jgi:XTP/dITP diphosphohydrolase
MRILLATSNPHKLEEIRAVLASDAALQDMQIVGLEALDRRIDEPIEDGTSFEANALLKARHYARSAGMLCLADDSGLEVDALGGEPGVQSARYAGYLGQRAMADLANNRLLLRNLGDIPLEQRGARFVCAMALVDPQRPAPPDPHATGPDVLALVRGTIEGRIILPSEAANPAEPYRGRGTNGFGYDPLFHVHAFDCTTAELTPQEKNAISHRGHAARAMARRLSEL